MQYVYIAGPMSSSGDYLANIRQAVLVAEELQELGLIPFVPHLSALWQFISPHPEYSYWLPMDLAWLRRCDMVLRLPGESHGADVEVQHALAMGIPVYYSVCDLRAAMFA